MLESHLNIRVRGADRRRFIALCKKTGIDASATIRSFMDQAVRQGLEYDPDTGEPVIKPRKLK